MGPAVEGAASYLRVRSLGPNGICVRSVVKRTAAKLDDDRPASDSRAMASHQLKSDDAAPPPPPILAGAHYFGGWFHCQPGEHCLTDHFHGFQPTGEPTDNWLPYYPSRTPLLGNLTVGLITEAAVAAEVKAADAVLDFFDVLYYGGGADCGIPVGGDPNLRYCLDTTLAWLLNSTSVWAQSGCTFSSPSLTTSTCISRHLWLALPARRSGWAWSRRLRRRWRTHATYASAGGRSSAS